MPGNSADDGTLLLGERNVLELIATGAPLAAALDTLCRLIDEQSGLTSSVYLLNPDGRQLSFAAGPNITEVWRRFTTICPVAPDIGACGSAVSLRRPVVVEDVATSPLFPPEWRATAGAAEFASTWSTPFFSREGRILGTFAVFDRVSRAPTGEALQLVERATRLASIVVEWHDAEERLRESERRFSAAFYSSPASMSISRFPDGRFMYVNDEFVARFGYTRAEVIGRTSLELGLWLDSTEREPLWRGMERGGAHNVEVQARTKSGAAIVLLLRMDRIQILGQDCVLAIGFDITDRKRAERALADAERRARVVLDTLPVGVTVTDRDGNIVLTNPAALRIWTEMIAAGEDRYARSKGWWHDSGRPLGADEWPSARARLKGETVVDDVIDIEAFDGTRKTIESSAAPIRDLDERITGAVFTVDDVSDRKKAERELHDSLAQMRALSGRLMRAQDDERRRIAQMLHETTAQDLAGLKMLLARLARTVGSTMPEADRSALSESIALAERSMSAVRTLSYLLHPPFLDEAGLLSALRWYAEGFAQRSGIAVDLELPASFDRLDQDVETALFRVVQEALINVHRHANSARAAIRLRRSGDSLTLEVEDAGRGLPAALLATLPVGGGALGVGVAGMRERLQQLGGTLDIASGEHGTIVRAHVPLASSLA